MSRRAVNAARRRYHARRRSLSPSAWAAELLAKKLRAKINREQLHARTREAVLQMPVTDTPARQAFYARQREQHQEMVRWIARVREAGERQAQRDHARLVASRDLPTRSYQWSPSSGRA
jgi:hypothetical protein